MFDRDSVRNVRNVLQFALEDVAKKLGVKVNVGAANFTSNNIVFKVEVAKVATGGQVLSRDAEDFKTYAPRWGLKATDLGRSFRYSGEVYTVTGAKPRSYKFPILAKRRSDGKTYKMPVDAVRFSLESQPVETN